MPFNKNQDFQALNNLVYLDITRKAEFQDMVELATIICDTSIGMINLIDRDKHYIKFKVGTKLDIQLKEDTFCQYIAKGQDLLIVPDTTKDQRFYDNPLISSPSFIRFYAGIPLITQNGISLGSICVLGTISKKLTESQKLRFKMLAKKVVEMLEVEFSLVA